MARVKLSAELKKAIAHMPAREKDKLLYRLVAKDPDLAERLAFQLLEKGDTTEERRAEVHTEIASALRQLTTYYHSPGYLLLDLRSLSGRINAHVKTTRDKYGEIELNFFLLNETLRLFGDRVRPAHPQRARTFNEYVVKRALKLLRLLNRLHEDYRLDFKDDMQTLAHHIGDQPNMMRVAIQHGLDVNWLLRGEIPGEEWLP